MSDSHLDFDFFGRWRSYPDTLKSELVLEPRNTKRMFHDREVTPGFMAYWMILVDSVNVLIEFHRERNLRWVMSITDLVNFNLTAKMQAQPYLSNNGQGGLYAVVFDPPNPLPYTSDAILKVTNLQKSGNVTIKKAEMMRYVPIMEKPVHDALTTLMEAHK